ncbi:MAG: DUF389 domain-containing protein [Deltaproteobacteria bacterium]|nr:DUF389 domain-containing protein [Deltaproteobacteria bacterium]MBZ0219818.1 DUF389 domain-containing protein [Deltaproteobacteria bacterium]
MARRINIILSPDKTNALLKALLAAKGVMSVQASRASSIKPPGDALSIEVLNRNLPDLMRLLDEHGLTGGPDAHISSSVPVSVISRDFNHEVVRDSSEAAWEEMEATLVSESSPTPNVLGLMAIAGFITAAGISTGTLHLVLAAMVIAPGFEPFIRITLGIVARSGAWRRGLRSVALGYAALLAGAFLGAITIGVKGATLLSGGEYYIGAGRLVSYWTTPSFSSLIISAAASAAGAILIASHRSILTAGVMIGLALIPTAALVSMGVVAGDWVTAWKALIRWAIEAALVVSVSMPVFLWKRFHVHRRKMAV